LTVYNKRTDVLKNYLSGGIIMNDIMGSPAYQGFLQKRIDEIITKDERCCEINKRILELEKELLILLPDNAKEKYLEIEELTTELTYLIPQLLT
jgi:hypothetical protein